MQYFFNYCDSLSPIESSFPQSPNSKNNLLATVGYEANMLTKEQSLLYSTSFVGSCDIEGLVYLIPTELNMIVHMLMK